MHNEIRQALPLLLEEIYKRILINGKVVMRKGAYIWVDRG